MTYKVFIKNIVYDCNLQIMSLNPIEAIVVVTFSKMIKHILGSTIEVKLKKN